LHCLQVESNDNDEGEFVMTPTTRQRRLDTETVRVTRATLKKLKLEAVQLDTTVHDLIEQCVAEKVARSRPTPLRSTQDAWLDFSLNRTITLGTPCVIDMALSPSEDLDTKELICNAPVPGFASFLCIQIGSTSLTIGNATDAFTYAQPGKSFRGGRPLPPDQNAVFAGTYSGLVPRGYSNGDTFLFVVTLRGMSRLSR
jgi:hypothetical protein